MSPVDDCSAYYLVAKRCKISKLDDPVIYDPYLVMRVRYCSQMSMCKSKTTVLYKCKL